MDAANEMNNAKAFNMIVLGGLLKLKPGNGYAGIAYSEAEEDLAQRHHHLIPMNEEAIKKEWN